MSAEETNNIQNAYIGDGIYAQFDGFNLRLYTSDGVRESNGIFFEPQEWNKLVDWMKTHTTQVRGR